MLSIEKITKLFENFTSHSDDYKGAMFINLYQKLPRSYYIYYDQNDNLTYKPANQQFNCLKEVTTLIDQVKLLENFLNSEDKNICAFCYSLNEWMVISRYDKVSFMLNITKNDENNGRYFNVIYTDNIEDSMDLIKNMFEKYEKHSKIEFGIAAIDCSNSLYTAWYEYNKKEIDIKKNYNDDIPYDKICDLISTEENSELFLFYGEPGTGKSSFIKHLMCKYPDKEFVFIDGALLANSSQEKLMSYFLENNETIFILEDCEKILVDRELNYNPVMSLLLNITDGIIADVLGIKIICTFNTSLKNIDKALLRKGRLSLKYEFKKLSKDKVKKLIGVEKEMTLADIYNNDEENDYSKKETKKIGF